MPMKISAHIDNSQGNHTVKVTTNDNTRSVDIPAKAIGSGSSVNGGEFLFLALATCYCNDIYREAAKRGITVQRVEVEMEGEFGAEGEPARNIIYTAKIAAEGNKTEIRDLMQHTDRVAEIQNTLRAQTMVELRNIEILNE
jgi:organic hydroperoxide reductase OsmC/OhrA